MCQRETVTVERGFYCRRNLFSDEETLERSSSFVNWNGHVAVAAMNKQKNRIKDGKN